MSIPRIHSSWPIQKTPADMPVKGRPQKQSVGLVFRKVLDHAALKTPDGHAEPQPPLSKQELMEIVNTVQAQMNARLMRAMSAEIREDADIRIPFTPDRFIPLNWPPNRHMNRESIPYDTEKQNQQAIRGGTGTHPPPAPDRFIPPDRKPSEPLFIKQDHEIHNRRGDFESIIHAAAAAHGVDPALIKSVIKVESNFNPKSTSPKGAMGLMQLMPGTARELGVQNAYDPAENIGAGTRYLSILLKRYEGNVTMALAAYNWGMGNLERRPAQMPMETKSYIENVTRRYEQAKA